MKASFCFPAGGSLLEAAGRGLPGGNSLSFASPKESKQRKGDPGCCVPPLRYGQPAVLGSGGVSLNSLRSNNAIPYPPEPPLLGASTRGNRERGKIPTRTRLGVSLFLQVFGILSSAVRYSCPHPLWMRRGAEGQTDQGKNLFERSELFLTPSGPSTAGCPQRSGGTQQPGSPFLLLTFLLAKQKKSELPPGTPRPTALSNERPAGARTGQVGGGIPA